MSRWLLCLLVPAFTLPTIGCGKKTPEGKKTTKKDKDKEAEPETAAGKNDTGTPAPDPKAKVDPAADPPVPAQKPLTDRDVRMCLEVFKRLGEAGGDKKPEKAADVPVAAWVSAGKATPEVDKIFAAMNVTLKDFGEAWARLGKLYARTYNLPAGEDLTREERGSTQLRADDFMASNAERAEAKKKVVELFRRSWENAARQPSDGFVPDKTEFDLAIKYRSSLYRLFTGLED